jgi:purine-nucleoside phosphorylase
MMGRLETAAERAGLALRRGTLACGAGPAYESPAEIRALQEIGADVATMSAAPETRYACELGMEIAVVAAITNPGTGIGAEPPDHGRVVQTAESMCGPLGDILTALLELA